MNYKFYYIKTFFAWLFIFSIVSASETNDSLIEKLIAKEEYDIAAKLLMDDLERSYSIKNCQSILSFNKQILYILESKITQTATTQIINEPDLDQKDVCKFILKNILSFASSHPLKIDAIVGSCKDIYDINKRIDDQQRKKLQELYIPLTDIDDANYVLQAFETLKKNTCGLEFYLEKELRSDVQNFDETLKLLKEVRTHKNILKELRTKYLSFVVISPYLAESRRLLLLADSNYLALRGKNKKALDNAVRVLAQSCNKEWLYQADESVRFQFIYLQRKLKNIASETEIEDYKVVTTLLNCNDTSKPRGANAWWK